VNAAAAIGGWVAAGIVGAVMIASRRVVGSRMEAVVRACHELRGPLAAARLGLAFGSRCGELSADRLRAIDTELGRATLALQDLADLGRATLALQDLADLGRSRPRIRELERVALPALQADCVLAADGLADEWGAGIAQVWDGPPVAVWGDRLRLAQALGNLIANAIEHGGGRVEVRGMVGEGVARLEVSDGGPGLAAPIAQLTHGARRGRGARGRGLAIAAAIVETHGGRVVTAPAQQGARVVLELPLTPEGPAARPAD
jgi:signal transduction histidine kinase